MPDDEMKTKMIETYADDMAQALGDGGAVTIKKVIEDEEAREAEKKNLSPESKRNKFFMLAGILLLGLAVGILGFIFLNKKAGMTAVAPQFTPMIFIDQTKFLEISEQNKDKIIKSVRDEANATEVKEGGIEAIYLTLSKKIVGLREFIVLLKGNLVLGGQELVDDNFLLGIANNGSKNVFLLIKMRSWPDIFDSLRVWENKMFYDLQGLFGVELSANTNYLLNKNFEDGIIENKNARILYDATGEVVLMYVFVDDTHVVVANDRNTVREIITRLTGNRLKQ